MAANLTPYVENVHALPDMKFEASPSNGSRYKAEKLHSTSSKVSLTVDLFAPKPTMLVENVRAQPGADFQENPAYVG